MQNKIYYELEAFIAKCDEIINSKFILADNKISELLVTIADSEMLFGLFEKITEDFDYISFKKVCLVPSKENPLKGNLILPLSTSDRLAFLFCLLMEIDSKKIDFNIFLNTYFYEDGSYFESFYAFCNSIILPFKNLVKAAAEELYSDETFFKDNNQDFIGRLQSEKHEKIKELLNEEKSRIENDSSFDKNEKEQATGLMDEFLNSLLTFDLKLINALFTGYKYMAKSNRKVFVNFNEIEKLISSKE